MFDFIFALFGWFLIHVAVAVLRPAAQSSKAVVQDDQLPRQPRYMIRGRSTFGYCGKNVQDCLCSEKEDDE